MNYLIAYNLKSLEIVEGTCYKKWKDYGVNTVVMAEVSSQAEALRRFLKDYEGKSDTRVQIVSITKLEEETDKMLMAWCYNHWAEWSEHASVNTGEDTIYFIRGFGEENFAYFGKDKEDTAYYYFKDSLSVDNLNRIKEQADEYIIAAPVLYMSQESLEDKNITFLKVDRDVDESELKVNEEIARFAMKAAYNKKYPLEATMISRNCGSDIEKGISTHFDGMHLNTDFIANLYALYGEERMNYVLANTVQMSDSDGRYSPDNKAWAKEININNAEDDRRTFYVNSHPAVLDEFITAYRKYVTIKQYLI